MAKKKIEVIYLKDKSPRAFQIALKSHDACKDARTFCKGKSLRKAWRYCRNYKWMLWYLRYMDADTDHYDLRTLINAEWNRVYWRQRNWQKRTASYGKSNIAVCKFIRERFKIK